MTTVKIKQKEIGVILLLCIPAFVFLTIPHIQSRSPNEIQLSSDTGLMKHEVLKHIPIGTEVKKAWQVMEQSDFGCSASVDGIIVSDYRLGKTNTKGKKTALSCTKKTGWLVSNVWTVNLAYQSQKITDASVFFRSTASDL